MDHEAALHYAQEGTSLRNPMCDHHRLPPHLGRARPGGRRIYFGRADDADREREREWFQQQIQEFVDAISPVWKLAPLEMSRAAVAHHQLHQRADVPGEGAARQPIPLDAVLGNQDFIPGFKPRVGGQAYPGGCAVAAFRRSRMPSWRYS